MCRLMDPIKKESKNKKMIRTTRLDSYKVYSIYDGEKPETPNKLWAKQWKSFLQMNSKLHKIKPKSTWV